MRCLKHILAFLICFSALLDGTPSFGEAASNIINLDIQGERYAIPEEYIGQVIPNPSKPQELVQLAVHYPDLAPVGNTSHRCEHKVALTDTKCPYFTIFLMPSDKAGKTYDGYMRAGAKLLRKEDLYEIYKFGATTLYRWKEADGYHEADCEDPPSPPMEEPFGHTTCSTWRRVSGGGAYRIMFDYSWREESETLDNKVLALVRKFYMNANQPLK